MASTKHLTFQAKVLIPIVTLLILLFSLTMWLVNRRLAAQLQEDARQTLTAVETVFRNSLDIRARNLVLRWENIVNEPRFKAVAQLAEPK
jgi:sensor domain CHASE-containing protein